MLTLWKGKTSSGLSASAVKIGERIVWMNVRGWKLATFTTARNGTVMVREEGGELKSLRQLYPSDSTTTEDGC